MFWAPEGCNFLLLACSGWKKPPTISSLSRPWFDWIVTVDCPSALLPLRTDYLKKSWWCLRPLQSYRHCVEFTQPFFVTKWLDQWKIFSTLLKLMSHWILEASVIIRFASISRDQKKKQTLVFSKVDVKNPFSLVNLSCFFEHVGEKCRVFCCCVNRFNGAKTIPHFQHFAKHSSYRVKKTLGFMLLRSYIS